MKMNSQATVSGVKEDGEIKGNYVERAAHAKRKTLIKRKVIH
jgi:hypothetical protein